MSLTALVALVIAVCLAAYVLWALLHPEDFE